MRTTGRKEAAINYLRAASVVTLCAALSFACGVPVSDEAGGTQIDVAPVGEPAVGALFDGDGHFCSGSVVHSPAGNEVVTAAHCIHEGSGGGYYGDLSFAPGYHDGNAPYGMWTVTSTLVAPGWIDNSDPDLDVGFVTVRQDGNPNSIESVTGANELGVDPGFTNDVTLTGYPDNADSPVVCQNTSSQQSEHQLRIACDGFPDGTSGGPWVVDAAPDSSLGTVVGVIGGYELGGDEDDVSYSSYFDSDIEELYRASTSETH